MKLVHQAIKEILLKFLELLTSLSPEIRQLQSMPSNAKYTSKIIQNDVLTAATNTVLKHIVNEVKEAEWYAIIADEAKDISRKEQLSSCIRYVNKDFKVNKHFIGFSDLCELMLKHWLIKLWKCYRH